MALIGNDYGITDCPPKNFNQLWCLVDKVVANIGTGNLELEQGGFIELEQEGFIDLV